MTITRTNYLAISLMPTAQRAPILRRLACGTTRDPNNDREAVAADHDVASRGQGPDLYGVVLVAFPSAPVKINNQQ